MAATGGFRSDLSITCTTDGNFGNVLEGVLHENGGNTPGRFNPPTWVNF